MTSPYFYPSDNRIKVGKSRVPALLRAVRGFLLSPAFILLSASVAAVSAAFGEAHTMTGIVIGAQLFGLALLLCDDFAAAMTPFLTVMCQGATLFMNWETILSYLFPWGICPAVGLIFHLMVYRKPLRNGLSLWGLVAAGSAILLGGLGAAELASPVASATNAFYYFGLSFGLVLLYFLFSSHYKREKSYDPYEHFLWQMLFTGLLCAFILWFRITELEADPITFKIIRSKLLFRNSLGNLMIMGLPAPFYFASKRSLPLSGRIFSFVLGLWIYLALACTTSRTAILFGTVLLILCLIYYFKSESGRLAKRVNAVILLAALVLVIALFSKLLSIFNLEKLREILRDLPAALLDPELSEARLSLFLQATVDFLSHPFFGIGILSQKNIDMHYLVSGCIVWYHMYFLQILGSLGLFGAAGYTLLLGTRARLMLFRPDARSIAISLTALSLFLYSMTDPGEFMPIPFGMMAMLAFVLLERHAEAHPDALCEDFNPKIFKKNKKTIDKSQKI
ncbi:MAG: O-antigen ligase family protein [Clostridia bacterium]|nr:O-antigen ligase family protein [Clostridia bacterium]